ncbi:CMD domain protein [Aureimonas jatrophae]|uniref:CMD domain protein, Avi_7170 family n=1 Tax=Aureimonas jatrophae TaxID=1166073 RepID=A0A1H0MLB8_9HYPH|nr:CMD domain protein [Aureimonas jatrophae]MBB3952901.1 CMD domain protein [Aureimonas jatrophae]SDO81202.1 CMD domain protein, Avi_7170 family [Aureimonas jatrophae]
MSQPSADIIDTLAGVRAGSALDAIRAKRSVARENAQRSYELLLHPADPSDVSLEERRAVAAFVALLHRDDPIARHYVDLLGAPDLRRALEAEVQEASAEGPYGNYPPGPLSGEDQDGPVYHVGEDARARLGTRLAAALEHAHLLVFHPRDARGEALGRLVAAGWSADGIVTLSQLVSFLAFQIRAAIGLRALVQAGEAA